MYTALVLDQQSHNKLVQSFKDLIPSNYKIYAHHMTINMDSAACGPLKKNGFTVGDKEELTVVSYAQDDKVIAVQVKSNVPSTNATKHVTVAVNVENGGKPFMSNKLTNWQETSPLTLSGVIQEVQ